MSPERLAAIRRTVAITKIHAEEGRAYGLEVMLIDAMAALDEAIRERDGARAEMPKVAESAAREARSSMRHEVACYLLDRADQYEDSCAAWQGLADAAHAMVDGTFADVCGSGELDDVDLIRRVDSFARQAQQPLGCRDDECPCKEDGPIPMPVDKEPG